MILKPIVNVDAFRQYYQEAVNCKTELNTNADTLALEDERRLEALLPIYDAHGMEMVKRVIIEAIKKDSQNYSEQVRKWADNSVVSMFLYETDNVLSDYIPDYLSEAAIEAIAKDLMEKEKQKTILKSEEGTEYEVICHDKYYSLLKFKSDDITLYAHHGITPTNAANITFSDEYVKNVFLSYPEAKAGYHKAVADGERFQKAHDILLEQYNEFKDSMLEMSREDIFDRCYKIAAVEDVYNYLIECTELTEAQQIYIINSGENVLMNLANDWNEYGDYNENINIHVARTFDDTIRTSKFAEYMTEDAEEEELE